MNCRPGTLVATMALLLALQSCASSSPQKLEAVDAIASVSVQQAPELDSLSEGDTVEFYNGMLAPFGQITIGRVYTAASGRLCKRIYSVASNELLSVACRAKKEHWYMRKLP